MSSRLTKIRGEVSDAFLGGVVICTLAFVLIFTFMFIDKCYSVAIQQDKHKRILAIINKKNEKIQNQIQARESNLN
jgi:hypothetical protein